MLIKELKYRMEKQNYTDFEISLVSTANYLVNIIIEFEAAYLSIL